MLVLTIDTSSAAVVAGLVSVDGAQVAVLAQRAPVAPRGHGELLSPAVAQCLAEARRRPAEVDAVVAGTGPGPYTGLRVGLVTAAAFADAIGAPAYGVCSLDAIAGRWEGDLAGGELLVVTDARRREVYWARYGLRTGTVVRTDGPAVARPADVPVDGLAAVAGAGAELYADAWPPGLSVSAARYPAVEQLARRALDQLRDGAQPAPLVPRYLRRPDAVVPGTPKAVSQWS